MSDDVAHGAGPAPVADGGERRPASPLVPGGARAPSPAAERNARYPGAGWYAALVMFLAYVVAQLSRQSVAMLAQPMKHDLGFTDEQLGVLMGLAYSLTQGLLLPGAAVLGGLVGRRRLLALGLAVWSTLTALGGLAQSFAAMLLARLGVGLGQSTLAPSALPLVSEAFPPERRAFPVAFAVAGSSFGLVVAPLLFGAILHATGGRVFGPYPLLGELSGWRLAFVATGVLGVLPLAMLAFVRERQEQPGSVRDSSLTASLRHFHQHPRRYAALFLSMPTLTVAFYALMAWMPTYLQRSLGLDARATGVLLAVAFMPAAVLGPVAAGWLGRIAASGGDRRRHLRFGLWLMPLTGIAIALPLQMPGAHTAAAAYGVAVLLSNTVLVYGVLLVQQVVASAHRAQAAAVLAAAMSLLGSGLGPALAGVLTTRVVGEDSLGAAIVIVLAATLPVGLAIQIRALRADAES